MALNLKINDYTFTIEEENFMTVLEYLKSTNEDIQVIIEDITALNEGKTDLTGDHQGTWQGFNPVETDPGIQSQVNQNTADIVDLQAEDVTLQSNIDANTVLITANTDLINSNYQTLISNGYLNAQLNGVVGDGVTDDTVAIQALLDLALTNGAVNIYFPEGVYNLSDTLIIYSNTTIESSENTEFKRNASYNPMFLNGVKGATYTGYDGQKNIKIRGGVINGNGTLIPTAFNHMSLGHSENITLENIRFKDGYDYHMVEMNGVRDSRITNCIFEDMIAQTSRDFTEQLQFDFMGSSGQFGSFGAYDNTTCENIVVENCVFKNGYRAIGSHTFSETIKIKKIHIKNCYFYNFGNLNNTGYALQLGCWEDSIIEGNVIELTDAFTLKGSRNNIISGNSIIDFRFYGIYIDDVYDTATGLVSIDSNDNKVNNNILKFVNIIAGNGSDAIRLNASTGNVVSDNYVLGAGDNGIQLTGASDNYILNNVVEGVDKEGIDGRGIEVSSSSNNNVVSDNVVKHTEASIDVEGIFISSTTDNNRVINNKVYNFTTPIQDDSLTSVLLYNSDENGAV